LIEKAKCIHEHVKLSENIFLECYLIAEYLMNRIFNQTLNWESSLIRLNKLINLINQNKNQSIRFELDHLNMYECKTYSLLKDVDVSSRDSKLKSRAFVDYLVDYNSTNVFRVWNLEKENVNEYRDVIFDESKLYDIYNKDDSLVTLEKTFEKKSQIELQNERTMKISINQLIDLNSENDEWLEISIKNRLMLKNKRVVELSTSSSKESSQRRSSRNFTLVSSQSLADSFIDYSSLSKSSSSESQADESKIKLKRDSSLMNLTNRILEMRRKREIKKKRHLSRSRRDEYSRRKKSVKVLNTVTVWIQIYTYRSADWSMILQSSLLLFYITSILRWFESHQVILWSHLLSSWSYSLINFAFIDRFSQLSWKSRYSRILRTNYSRIVNDSLNLIQRTRQIALWH
jgi:hypothetical protein